ncbi:MAG: DUF4012 domain-containing protein [Dehalococcoidia bacterium]|nr:DUF4012 domain-containing protein [Dehalococcoidia bacterium]
MQLTFPAISRGRLGRWLALGLVLAAGCYLAITAVRLLLVYREMLTAERRLVSAETLLRREGLAPSPAALAQAEAGTAAAADGFRSAGGFFGGDPLLSVLARVPWLGEQVATAGDLAAIGYDASRIGLAGVSVLRALSATSADGKGPVGKELIDFMQAVEPQTAEIRQSLAAVRERRDRIAGRHSAPPLASFVERVDERLLPLETSFQRYESARTAAPELLGQERPMTYLVLGLDNTELLPGGGIVGVYGLVTFNGGRVVGRSFHEVDDLIARWQERTGGEYIEPPGPLKRYLLRDWSWNFALAAWSPDFPAAARQALFFYERAGAPPVDGVIGMDFAALEGLLAVAGPREIEGYGITVDAANVTEETLLRARRPGQAQEESHAFARAVAATVLDGVFNEQPARWDDLLEALDGLATAKHLYLYATEPRLQDAVRDLGWAAEVKAPPGDYLMLVDASVHSTKLNLVVEETAQLAVELDWTGAARHTLDVSYRNGLPEWARGRDPGAVERLMGQGFYGDYLRVLAPPAAQLVDLRLNGGSAGPEEIALEDGKASFGRYVALPAGAQAEARFVYDVPAVAGVSSGGEYKLLVQKQPGSAALPLAITVRPPEGARVVSMWLDGRRLEGNPPAVETDLSRDRELVVRYEW